MEIQSNKEIQKRRIMIFFIEAAKEILDSEGLSSFTIRKIAEKAGYNSATIYNYFEDLNHLLLFASARYFKEYSEALADSLKADMNAKEQFYKIYDTFNYYTFNNPEIFYNMFFGSHSGKLSEVLEAYYVFFPEELTKHSDHIQRMLQKGNIYLRDSEILKFMSEQGFIKEDEVEYLMQIISRVQESFLHEVCIHRDSIDIVEHSKKFNRLLRYLLKDDCNDDGTLSLSQSAGNAQP